VLFGVLFGVLLDVLLDVLLGVLWMYFGVEQSLDVLLGVLWMYFGVEQSFIFKLPLTHYFILLIILFITPFSTPFSSHFFPRVIFFLQGTWLPPYVKRQNAVLPIQKRWKQRLRHRQDAARYIYFGWWLPRLRLNNFRRSMQYVLVFMIHVGGTCCVTSNTGNNMKIHARISLGVECIRTCLCFYFYLMFEYNDE
jgi:hypothetical protein